MKKHDHITVSNPSLITAGLPSSSIMTTRLIPPPNIIKQNQYLNQNRATDTQPITLSSENTDHSQNINHSYRTISDTYLNLSRKDIDDIMTALHTLVYYIQNSMKDRNREDFISTDNNSLKNSSYYPRYSLRHSLSSDRYLTKRMYAYPVETIPYDFKRKQEQDILRQLKYYENYFHQHNVSSYPSYSSNTIFYTSTSRSNLPSKEIYHSSRQDQSTIKIPSENQCQQSIKKNLSSLTKPLSSYIHEKFISIDQNQLQSKIQILPEYAHTLQILQNNPIHSFMSTDSLNTKNISHKIDNNNNIEEINVNQISGMGDQLNLNKIDVSTQWSLQILKSKSNEMNIIKSDLSLKCQNDQENSTILTELSQSIKTNASNNSTINKPLISNVQSIVNNSSLTNDLSNIQLPNLTKSETEQILKILNIPSCQCSIKTQQPMKNSSIDDSILFDNGKKKRKSTPIKYNSKRTRHHRSKSSKRNNQKRSQHLHRQSQSNNRLITEVIDTYNKTIDSKEEDSLFDFFDIDTTFSDTYDRLFTYTTTSEK